MFELKYNRKTLYLQKHLGLHYIAWKFSRFVWMEGGALLQFNVNEGLSHPAQPTNVLVGKMSYDKIPDKSCDFHCVPESEVIEIF